MGAGEVAGGQQIGNFEQADRFYLTKRYAVSDQQNIIQEEQRILKFRKSGPPHVVGLHYYQLDQQGPLLCAAPSVRVAWERPYRLLEQVLLTDQQTLAALIDIHKGAELIKRNFCIYFELTAKMVVVGMSGNEFRIWFNEDFWCNRPSRPLLHQRNEEELQHEAARKIFDLVLAHSERERLDERLDYLLKKECPKKLSFARTIESLEDFKASLKRNRTPRMSPTEYPKVI